MPASPMEITLHLKEVDYFFTAPELNPLKEKAMYESGADTVFAEVKAGRLRDTVHLNLFLPPDQITPGLDQQIKAALNDYCRFKIREAQDSLNLQWRAGRRGLWFGLLILAVSLIFSGLGYVISDEATSTLVKALGGFMYNGFMIIGWVSLWTPFELLVFDWWPDWVSKRAYERMTEMEIDVRPEIDSVRIK